MMELLSNSTAIWNIYRSIEGTHATIFRFPKDQSYSDVQKFLKNFTIVRELGLPTLGYAELFECSLGIGVKTEDVNYGMSRKYLSHNSVTTDEKRYLDSQNPFLPKQEIPVKVSEYEEARYRNRLTQITNFTEFVQHVKEVLFSVSKECVLIEFDAYFFGTLTTEISTIDFKLVDLDHITKDCSIADCLEKNLSEFHKAIEGFVRHFVRNEEQEPYLLRLFQMLA